MKRLSIAVMVAVAILLIGCIRAPNYPGVVQIQTDEIAFLVDMTSDDAQFGSNAEIQKKDIPIPGYFVRTGRWNHQGYWRPTLKVIAVSQAPVRRVWDSSSNTEVKVVSKESSGFVVPIIVNACIEDRQSAIKYLAAFRPIVDEKVDWSRLKQRDWAVYVKEYAQPLGNALDNVVRSQIIDQLSVLFVKTPILNAEVASKIYLQAISEGMTADELNRQIATSLPGVGISFTRDVPSLKKWAKENYGITIMAMAADDGLVYESQAVQDRIDELAAGVMKQRTLQQDAENARAEQIVRTTQAETLAREARLQSETIRIRAQQQEIENSKTIAEATADGIRSGKTVPAGTFPANVTTLIIQPDYKASLSSK